MRNIFFESARKQILALLFLILFLSSCKPHIEILNLEFDKDLFPEGIAIDPKTRTIFLNSLRQNKIVQCQLNGDNPKDFIKDSQFGYLSGFGMIVKGDTLYALGNSLLAKDNKSILITLNTESGALIESFELNDTSQIYLNDIVVGVNNDTYITDSESNKIYTVGKSRKNLEVFLEDDEIAHSNGITISDNSKYLYVASFRNGIRVIDIERKTIINNADSDNGGIDGLKFYKNSLIGIVNAYKSDEENGIYRYFLNPRGTSIVSKEKIIKYSEGFDIPTTFDIVDNYIMFVINSQLDNFDQESKQTIETSKLKDYLLLRMKLDE